jgi:hypothetical protein
LRRGRSVSTFTDLERLPRETVEQIAICSGARWPRRALAALPVRHGFARDADRPRDSYLREPSAHAKSPTLRRRREPPPRAHLL